AWAVAPMAAAITTTPIPWCAAAIGWCRWMSTCPAVRQPPRRWFTGSCSCRRKSAAPGPSSVAEEAQTEAPTPLELLGHAVASLLGVRQTSIRLGELTAHADRDGLAALMLTLRDDPRFPFAQVMDICGVVYNLLSVSLNHRLRVVVTTDAETPVASVHGIWPAATWWEREAWDLYGIIFSGQPDLRRILTDSKL